MSAAPEFRSGLLRGVFLWVVVGALGVAVRGVQWEESYERAQAMLGLVPYPPWHPLYIYGWNAFTLQYHASAALLWLTHSPLVVCGLRNLIAIWILLVPMFLLGASFTRNVLAGHLAALLMLANAHTIFQSYYDNNVWPNMFTNGSIGLGWVLMCLCAFCYSRFRLGFFLVALMPLIHGGQWPPVLVFALWFYLAFVMSWLFAEMEEDRAEAWELLRNASVGIAAGVFTLSLFALAWWVFRVQLVGSGTEHNAALVTDVWQRFTYFEDIHRRPGHPPRFGPLSNSGVGVMLSVLLGTFWWHLRLRHRFARAGVGLLFTRVCAIALVSAWFLQRKWGMETPYWVIGWLPYRVGNLAVIFMMAMVAAGCTALPLRGRRFPIVAMAATTWLALRLPLGVLVPETLHARYLMPPEGPLFLLTGAALVEIWRAIKAYEEETRRLAMRNVLDLSKPEDREKYDIWSSVSTKQIHLPMAWAPFLPWPALAAWGAVAWYLQFPAACMAVGAALSLCNIKWNPRAQRRLLPAAITFAVAALLAAQYPQRHQLPVTPFELQVRERLAQDEDQSPLLVTPLYTINYQEKLNRGVFATFETQLLIPYMPALGPRIEGMLTDMYHFHFGEPWDWKLDWWQGRTVDEWQALAKKYHLCYVLCPEDWPLQLPEVMRGEGRVLYRIPASGANQ